MVSSAIRNQHTESCKNEETEEYVPNERKDEPSGKQNINEVEISSFYDKELKLMVIKVLTGIWENTVKNVNEEMANVRKYQKRSHEQRIQ